MAGMVLAVEIYVSYSTKDQRLWEELENHLIPLQRKGYITLWDPHKHINAGESWSSETDRHLSRADLILLLVSPNYLASDYLYQIEMKRAVERHEAGEAMVLPILLKSVYWQDEPFGKFHVLPENARPITMWRKKEAAFLQVAMGIRKAVDQLLIPRDAKTINSWISERIDKPREALQVGESYTLNLNIKDLEMPSSFIESGGQIPPTDVPEKGLDTEWLVYSRTVELQSTSDAVTTTSAHSWTAQFSLHIPREGDSSTRQLQIVPHDLENASLMVLIYANGELYRDCLIELAVARSSTTQLSPGTNAAMVQTEVIYAPANQLGLHSSYRWQQPPAELKIAVLDPNNVYVNGSRIVTVGEHMDWCGTVAGVEKSIKKVRLCTDEFRVNEESYLEDIDALDLAHRLEHFKPQADWAMLNDESDSSHQQSWNKVAENSEDLLNLAIYGYDLYGQFFPPDTRLRSLLDSLEPGYSLHINWTRKGDNPWIPSVPWGLMYLKKPELPIDPFAFLGLRFRIQYTSYAPQMNQVKNRQRHLGAPNDNYRGNCLYWENEVEDATADEARWQHSLWARWPKQVFISDKQALLELLRSPESKRPMPVLYFYCKCNLKEGIDQPVLYFANGTDSMNTLTDIELLQSELADQPLIFINACTTSASDPYSVNELQDMFFKKGCSAYLGTETKVPIHLGSCFAAIFFHFFYRKIKEWPEPIAAGEAMAQARLFLWTQYKNIGGLLYTYINQSQLFLADAEELKKLGM